MLNPRFSPVMLVLALSGMTSSCWLRKSPKAFTPPPPQTQPQVDVKPPIVASKPPEIAGDPSATVPQAPATIPEIAAPPAPKPTPPRRNTNPVPPSRTNPTTPPTEQPPNPRLGQLFTPEEQRQYNQSIDNSLNRVKRVLDQLSRKSLNPDQQAEVGKITTFQKQAEQAREAQDLITAANLAARADVLAQDLLGRIP